jgi:hypothetical protein
MRNAIKILLQVMALTYINFPKFTIFSDFNDNMYMYTN